MIRPSIALLGLLWAGFARAEPTVLLPREAGNDLEAGQTVEVRFAGIPGDVEEFELLLVGGSGQPFVLRLSESLPGHTRSFLWTVPNLELGEARLMLRMERDDREVEGERGEPFSIGASPSRALTRLELRQGELWVEPERNGKDAVPASLPAAGLDHEAPSLERPAAFLEFVTPPPSPGLSEALSPSDVPLDRPAGPPVRAAGLAAPSRVPLSIPPRI